MMRLLSEMLKLPLAIALHSMEIVVDAVREFQKTTDLTITSLIGGATRLLVNAPLRENDSLASNMNEAETANSNLQIVRKEDRNMSDQDLSGDDLKYVSYSILFTKRDLEATFETEMHDVVNYSTNGGSYGGLKIAHFMGRVQRGQVPRPDAWKNPENNYPPGVTTSYFTSIPTEDEKYITFIYEVDRRIPREDKEYDREQVRALKGIKEGINNVGGRIGP
jgi:hypothetical protein